LIEKIEIKKYFHLSGWKNI